MQALQYRIPCVWREGGGGPGRQFHALYIDSVGIKSHSDVYINVRAHFQPVDIEAIINRFTTSGFVVAMNFLVCRYCLRVFFLKIHA